MNLALFSGLLLALSFPNIFHKEIYLFGDILAWASLVPLLLSLEKAALKQAFKLGYAAGLLFFLLSLYWINFIGPMGLGAGPAWLALSGYLALYPAVFCLGACWGRQRGLKFEALWVPAWWTLLEYARETFLTGYPWVSLGSSQSLNSALLPLASVTGIYGLHYAVALGNVLIWQALRGRALGWHERLASVASLVLVLGLCAAAVPRPPASSTVKVALLQGNFNEDQEWDETYRHQVMAAYGALMDQALAAGAKVMIWPESAFPAIFNQGGLEAQALLRYAKLHKVSLIFGSTLVDSLSASFTNSAVFIGAQGELSSYDKRHLVPFGEFVPFRHAIPLLNQVLSQVGLVNFQAGSQAGYFESGAFKSSPLICYESVYGQLARESHAGAISLITLDTWFGDSPAPRVHLSQSVFRAVEGGRWVARAAATGISAFIDPQGHIVSSLPLNTRGLLVQDIDCDSTPTLYMRHGAWFIWLCFGFVILAVLFRKGKLD